MSNLKNCPWDSEGWHDVHLTAMQEHDDRRYYTRSVVCGHCEVELTATINYGMYFKLGEKAASDHLGDLATVKWNAR